jgi:hypothetical protein
MILVSINTGEDFCVISIIHRFIQVDISKKLLMSKTSLLRTLSIFMSVFGGVFILFMRLFFSKIQLKNIL